MTRAAAGPGRRGRRVVAALLLSAALVVLTAVGIGVIDSPVHDLHPDPVRGLAYGLLGCASVVAVLLLRRRAVGPAVAVAGAFSMAAAVLQPVPPFALLPFAIAVALAMSAGATRWALASVAVAYGVSIASVFLSDSAVAASRGFGTMVVLIAALGAGAFLRARSARRAEEARLQHERQRTAIEEERLRIARELHDVLAHSLSSIAVQAGVGLHLAPSRPEAATDALETIRVASRDALQEVRGVLGILRRDDTAPLAPGPDLDALHTLVEGTRRSGARVDLDDRLLPRPSAAVQLAVYRVVQEALTNAARHAPGAAVAVALSREPGGVLAVVRDRLPGSHPREPVAGNGVTGMRERAAALGGSLETRVHDDGLEVVLHLPEGTP